MLVSRRNVDTGFRPGPDIELPIGPMPADDMRRLIELATEAAPLRAHDVDEVIRRSGGNPLFATEILRTARDVGSLDAVPLSLEATLAVQIDALDVAARKLLRYASVLGRVFPRAVFEAIVRAHDADADLAALSRLDEFIEHDGDELRFRNGLVRDTTYESVAFRLRTQLHAVAAAEIERRDADSADALALHFSRAGDAEQTWRYARIAAERARRSYANVDAARYYEMALAAAKRMPALDRQEHVAAWTELGDTRELAGLFAASLDAYRRALHAAGDDAVTRADLLFGRARAKERAGEFSAALRDLTIGLRLLNDLTTPQAARARARLRSFAAMVQFGQDKPRRALARAEVAVAEARSADEPSVVGARVDRARPRAHRSRRSRRRRPSERSARDLRSDRRSAHAGEHPRESRLSERTRVPMGRSGRVAAFRTRTRSAHRRFGRRRLRRIEHRRNPRQSAPFRRGRDACFRKHVARCRPPSSTKAWR